MSSAADRNLLFGILAFQMDFVSSEQFIAAMHAWALEKTTPLGEILHRNNALGADELELLEALVGKHLARHGNDPEKSLAAVSSIESVHDQLKQLADPEIEASLAHVSRDRHRDDPLATISVGESTSAGQRFRILRPHAKGGLGEVFVASDEELPREVALKQIQSHRADDPNNRSRFLLEAKITGGLEHPGIVPVYGLGTYADGRPFYAMRFIRGDNLKDAIERFHRGLSSMSQSAREKGTVPLRADADGKQQTATPFISLPFRKLLGRFIDVCNAIDYAHSRGVLHRDLKPGNIMLGKYGETLVVDWGLAKSLGHAVEPDESSELPIETARSGSAPTQMGAAVGTPQYMSPEQASGRLDLLGPHSDVYSLGATLYCLLTGQPPLAGINDAGEILRRVECGDIGSPRNLNSQVPKALESICLKAMALRSSDRYHSPHGLADDLEHWLADEPVSACPDNFTSRLARFSRRNRAWVQAGAASLALITVASIIALLQINAAKDEAVKLAAEKTKLAASNLELAQKEYLLETANRRRIDLVVQKVGSSAELNNSLPEDLAESIRKIPHVKECNGGLMDVVSFPERDLLAVIINGWPADSSLFRDRTMLSGRFPTAEDHHKVIIGEQLAANLGKKLHDTIKIYDTDVEIIGIFRSASVFENGSIGTLLSDMQDYMNRPHQVTGFVVRTDLPKDDSLEYSRQIAELCKQIEALSNGIVAVLASDVPPKPERAPKSNSPETDTATPPPYSH